MAYVTYSEGFRSGGFNGRATAPNNTGPYDPESVKSWEAGTKLTLMDNRFQINLAAFSLKYDDKQETIVKPGQDGQATLTVVENASSAKIEGLEMDFKWILLEGLSLSGNVGLLDASYDDYVVPSATGIVDQTSRALLRAPDMTAGLGVLFERQMGEGHWFVATLNYTWKDDYYISSTANLDHSPGGYIDNPSKVDALGILDASINWETERWTISLFGKNLTDETYLMHLDVGANVVATSATNSAPTYAQALGHLAREPASLLRRRSTAEVLIEARIKKGAIWRLFLCPRDDRYDASGCLKLAKKERPYAGISLLERCCLTARWRCRNPRALRPSATGALYNRYGDDLSPVASGGSRKPSLGTRLLAWTTAVTESSV